MYPDVQLYVVKYYLFLPSTGIRHAVPDLGK